MKKNKLFCSLAILLMALLFMLGSCPSPVGPDGKIVPQAPKNFAVSSGDGVVMLQWEIPENSSGIIGYQVSGGPTETYMANWVSIPLAAKVSMSNKAGRPVGRTAGRTAENLTENPVESPEENPAEIQPENQAEDAVFALEVNEVVDELDINEFASDAAGGRAAWMDIPGSGRFTTSVTVSGLVNETNYTFEVRAIYANGISLSTATMTATPRSDGSIYASGPPLQFKATAGDGEVTLKWSSPLFSQRITWYQVSYGYTANYEKNWVDVPNSVFEGEFILTRESFTVTGLINNKSYTFEVRALSASGCSLSATATAIPSSGTPDGKPAAPYDLTAEGGEEYDITLRWTPGDAGDSLITHYQINVDNIGFSMGVWVDFPTSTILFETLYDDSGMVNGCIIYRLNNGTSYTFRIRAVNATGEGVSSEPVTAIPGDPETLYRPEVPLSYIVVPGNGEVKLSWDIIYPNGSPLTGVQVSYARSSIYMEDWQDIPGAGSETNSYTVKSLTNGVSYSFQIRGVNANGPGKSSPLRPATPQISLSLDPPSAVRNLQALATDKAVEFTWLKPEEGGSEFSYSYSFGKTAGYVTSWNFNHTSIPMRVINDLVNDTDYTFEVRAYNPNAGLYGPSVTITATPVRPDPPELPSKVIAVIGKGYDITSNYASSPDIKHDILNLTELRYDGFVYRDENLVYGEFETVYGSTISEYGQDYSKNLSVDVGVGGGYGGFSGSFDLQVKKNFDSSRTERNDYAFATSRAYIVNDAYALCGRDMYDVMRNYLDPTFAADINSSMTPAALVAKYGTHAMAGAVLGARLDYSMSSQKVTLTSQEHIGNYTKARAEASYLGLVGGHVQTVSEVDSSYSSYYESLSVDVKTFAVGGDTKWAYNVHDKNDYTQWLDSLNEDTYVWIDYYPYSLIPIWELTANASRRTAIKNWCTTYIKKNPTVLNALKHSSKTISFGTLMNNEDATAKATSYSSGNDNISSFTHFDPFTGKLVEQSQTNWSLEVDIQPRLASYDPTKNAYNEIEMRYTYTVKESISDWTLLKLTGTKRLNVGAWFTVLEGDTYEYNSGTIIGENWNWNQIYWPINNTLVTPTKDIGPIRSLQVKIDGIGDDLNNIGISGSLNVNFMERTMVLD